MSLNDLNLSVARVQMQTSPRTRVRLYRQLERLLRNNVRLTEALDSLWRRASNEGRRPTDSVALALAAWQQGPKSGRGLAQAMASWIPNEERLLIEAGEQAGQLPQALADVVFLAQGTRRIRGAIISGLAYPIALFAALLLTLWYLAGNIVPAFATILPPEQWTGMGAWLARLAWFAENYTVAIAVGTLALVILYLATVSRWTGRTRLLVEGIPPWSFYRLSQGIGFLLASSALLRAGMQMTEVFDRLRQDSSPYLRERLSAAVQRIRSGDNFGNALYKTGMNFPDKDIVQDMRTYASLTGFNDTLAQVAREWLEDVVRKVQGQAQALNMVMLFLMFVLIVVVFTGLYAVTQQIGDAAQPRGIL
jgi:type II secretory pathway component PulF